MMRKVVFVAIFTLATPVLADWAVVPLEVLVDEADLIVAGKVTKVQDGGFALNDRKYDVAVVEVSRIVKSFSGKPKEIHIAQPGMERVTSADIRFQPGQQGIWLLTKDPERNVFWARHPSQFQPDQEQKKLESLMVARTKVAVGKPVNGLAARAELVEGPRSFQVRFSLANVTDQPITVCDYVGNRPLQVHWIGPDGKELKSKHYDWLAYADLLGLMKNNFVTIQPGGVRFIGQGIVFQSPTGTPTRTDNVAQAGQHQVTVSFVNKEGGKQFGLENIWTGTVPANELTFSVK